MDAPTWSWPPARVHSGSCRAAANAMEAATSLGLPAYTTTSGFLLLYITLAGYQKLRARSYCTSKGQDLWLHILVSWDCVVSYHAGNMPWGPSGTAAQ